MARDQWWQHKTLGLFENNQISVWQPGAEHFKITEVIWSKITWTPVTCKESPSSGRCSLIMGKIWAEGELGLPDDSVDPMFLDE